MEGGPPMFGQDFTCPALLEDTNAFYPYGAVTRYGPTFQTVPVLTSSATGLVRVRSPLLTESRLMSFPPGTEMFQFPGFASAAYGFSGGYLLAEWVAPFGDPRIKACSRLPKAFRSVPRPSSPLGAKASTRCPCFPRPPQRQPHRPDRDAGTSVPARDEQEGKRPSQDDSSDNSLYKAAAPRLSGGNGPAYPCQMTRPARRRKTKKKGRNAIDLPAPVHARRTKASRAASMPADGHLITTSRCPKNSAATPGPTGCIRPMQAGCRCGRPVPPSTRPESTAPPRRAGGKRGGLVGLGRLERPTSRLSGVRSNQLSYRPEQPPRGPRHHPRAANGGSGPIRSSDLLCEGTCRRRRGS